MLKNIKSNNKGFTLMELIIVIAIMAILASVAVPSYENIIHSAENNLALANINIVRKFVTNAINLNDFSNEEKFKYIENKSTPDEDINYLSRYIEVTWEDLGDDTGTSHDGNSDNSNYLNILNPTSNKVCIVNWSEVVDLCKNSMYANQSLYISDNDYLSYTPGSPQQFDKDYFNGALVMWYDDKNADHIYFYYVNRKAEQSEEYYVLTNPAIE